MQQQIITYLQSRQLSDQVNKEYYTVLWWFDQWLQSHKVFDHAGINQTVVQHYYNHLSDTYAPATATHKAKILREFGRYLNIDALIRTPLPRSGKRLPKTHTPEQITRMIDRTNSPRYVAMIDLLYSTGIHVHELINLHIYDIDLTNHQIELPQRTVVFGSLCAESLTTYLLSLPDTTPITAPLFHKRTKEGYKPLTANTITKIVREAGDRADIHATPRSLRASCITHLARGGMDLFTLRELAGIASADDLADRYGYWNLHAAYTLTTQSLKGIPQ